MMNSDCSSEQFSYCTDLDHQYPTSLRQWQRIGRVTTCRRVCQEFKSRAWHNAVLNLALGGPRTANEQLANDATDNALKSIIKLRCSSSLPPLLPFTLSSPTHFLSRESLLSLRQQASSDGPGHRTAVPRISDASSVKDKICQIRLDTRFSVRFGTNTNRQV